MKIKHCFYDLQLIIQLAVKSVECILTFPFLYNVYFRTNFGNIFSTDFGNISLKMFDASSGIIQWLKCSLDLGFVQFTYVPFFHHDVISLLFSNS